MGQEYISIGLEIYNRTKDITSPTPKFPPEPWRKDLFSNMRVAYIHNACKYTETIQYQEIPKSDLRPRIDSGFGMTTVCINTAIYLPWLVSMCLKQGVVFKRAIFNHISEAAIPGVHHSGGHAEILINCTGLGSSMLGGVQDQDSIPVRGQIVIVQNNPGGIFPLLGTDDGPEEGAYMMSRAAGGGTVLGGSYQKGNSESQAKPNLAIRIMKRSIYLCPELTGRKGIEHLDVVRHGVGLRPFREGGTRVTKERINGLGLYTITAMEVLDISLHTDSHRL